MRLLVCAIVACSPTYKPMGPTVHDIPAPAPVARTEGPLSIRAKVPETPWPERQKQMDRARHVYLDQLAIHEDRELYLKLATELHVVSDYMRQQTALVEHLAPYALDSVSNSYIFMSERAPLCARPPGEMWHCDPDLTAAAPSSEPPFSIDDVAPGVAMLTVRDLGTATWPGFTTARLAAAKAIVVDLRAASGSDPRPLLSWLEQITGRAPFKPLRDIARPADLAPYVASYAARYQSETRDAAVWASLVGTMPPATKPATTPIAVIVGDRCGPACELIARSLVTYAHATLFGNVTSSGRLAHDEPALLVLPHSKIEIYFHATRYTLNAEIERATGATAEWHPRDTTDRDLLSFAVKELTTATPTRCDAMPAYATPASIPQPLKPKLQGAFELSSCRSPDTIGIRIATKAPLSAIRRYVQGCHADIGGYFDLSTRSLATLSQIAQSDLVERIDIECERPPRPN